MNNSEGKLFAGFIITYRRADELSGTIDAVMSQSLAPEKLLIIDNGADEETERIVSSKENRVIVYIKNERNLGPAGAARIGIELLSKEGFKWIYWGDDNDPPRFDGIFAALLNLPENFDGRPVGILGAVGQGFSRLSGNHIRISDDTVLSTKVLQVNSIAGGQCMIVSGALGRSGLLPDADLFFGFEELDYSLLVQKAGYVLLTDSHIFHQSRLLAGKMGFKRPIYFQHDERKLIRQYYSTRNSLLILRKNGLFLATFYQALKVIGKMIYAFRFGWAYGRKNVLYLALGLVHFVIGRKGQFSQGSTNISVK